VPVSVACSDWTVLISLVVDVVMDVNVKCCVCFAAGEGFTQSATQEGTCVAGSSVTIMVGVCVCVFRVQV
jgi:hypothetical protein